MESNSSQNNPTEVDMSKETNQERISGIWSSIKVFLNDLLDIREDSDRDETIDSVRKDISFQGHNAWILIFSIFIASIGLNADSTAVVIGAMLISPLMGPIVGMGLGTAINDDTMLRRSFINLGVMVSLSLLTASLYFTITPLKEMTSELYARTYPTTLDVLIAIFGGLALIVAKAKKGTISNAIAGVAIATALMPPLCTAGYGIATLDLEVFGGAMYLFCINTIFIALATFVVCKLLKFPMVKYANQAKRKRVSRFATVIGVIAVLPSVYLFYQLYKAQVMEIEATNFAKEYIVYDGMRATPDWNRENNTLDVVLMGEVVPEPVLNQWEQKFYKIVELKDSKINFYQGSSVPEGGNPDVEVVQEELINNLRVIQDKDTRITMLENQLKEINQEQRALGALTEELKINYPQIGSVSYANSIYKDFQRNRIDTTAVYEVSFKENIDIDDVQINEVLTRIHEWLVYRVGDRRVEVKEVAPRSIEIDTLLNSLK